MTISTALAPTDLAGITAFADLPADTVAWLLTHGEGRSYAAGETIFEPGAPAEFMTAVLRGGIQFYVVKGAQRDPIFRVEAGQVSGVLPYSRLRIIAGQGVAAGETVLYRLHRDQFPALEAASPELVQRLVAIMNDRSRDQVRAQERDDKLRALGKLSAGLAHELNNPAAAIARAAEALAKRAAAKPALFVELVGYCPSPEAMRSLTGLAVPSEPAAPLSALARADAEDALAEWLETNGVADGYCLATAFLEAGITTKSLAATAALLPPEARPAAFAWLEGQLTTMQLVRDVQEAGGRISKLVADVKTYSHMDRAGGFEPLDVTAGLESTLNMLGFLLRKKNIKVTREYAADLPRIRGQVSSLNQVWTNLLDNAIDALPAQGGELTLRTVREGDFVRVFLIDNGSGIPTDVLPHIFEPFFTTKQAGDGSGLGLDIAQQIIRQHDGRLEVHSVPGRTEFCAWLPVMGG
ncbi:ATP-binding protein [Hymenobacter sp. DH14]|uniref:histidine kinase n=1 Tax=Hymenobacter cyanobacteriorum TaxID=2926463 RepID=A0A9X1VK56_9BACT|nr:ATP-binding protein [Hymenobacter cyanobacteriorum]MCI1190153.1 ATP-binding protein [Hymenobacter cyanobacteriorum]